MDYRKRLKNRLIVAITYIIIGIFMIATELITKTDNNFISAFGFTLLIIGIARIKKHFIITKNDDSIKKYEIAETDERNIEIMHKSRSAAFIIYVVIMCVATIILSFLNMHNIARWISLSAMTLVVIYWICYFIIRKKF